MDKQYKKFCKATVRGVVHTYREYNKTHIATYAERTAIKYSAMNVVDNLDYLGVSTYNRIWIWEYVEAMLDRLIK